MTRRVQSAELAKRRAATYDRQRRELAALRRRVELLDRRVRDSYSAIFRALPDEFGVVLADVDSDAATVIVDAASRPV